jgi:hypothetical protein
VFATDETVGFIVVVETEVLVILEVIVVVIEVVTVVF